MTNDGGPVHPTHTNDQRDDGRHFVTMLQTGLSVLDYFAAKAMAATLTQDGLMKQVAKQAQSRAMDMMEAVAATAYAQAQAMVDMRNKLSGATAGEADTKTE